MFEKSPEYWPLQQLIKHCDEGEKTGMQLGDGTIRWVPARPEGSYYSFTDRLSLAWKVFTGKADAVYWPKGQ
jgi:hypothetical protein